MFKINKKSRRLSKEEINKFEKDGYLTGLPVFDKTAKTNLNDFFISLSSRLNVNIDLNQTAQWQKASLSFWVNLKGRIKLLKSILSFFSSSNSQRPRCIVNKNFTVTDFSSF